MKIQFVKVQNKKTGLFWYGFGLGETYKQSLFDLGDELFEDVEEERATWFDKNNVLDEKYLQENVTDEHLIIEIDLE